MLLLRFSPVFPKHPNAKPRTPVSLTQLYLTDLVLAHVPARTSSTLLAEATRVVIDHRGRVLPGQCPRRRLEVQTLLVALVVVGAATGQLLELLLVLVMLLQQLLLLLVRELLTDGAASSDADAAASTTTDATTFKLCLDANSGGMGGKLHDERM